MATTEPCEEFVNSDFFRMFVFKVQFQSWFRPLDPSVHLNALCSALGESAAPHLKHTNSRNHQLPGKLLRKFLCTGQGVPKSRAPRLDGLLFCSPYREGQAS